MGQAFVLALQLIAALDAELLEIIARSFAVSLAAVAIAAAIGLPAGAALAVYRFPGRRAVIVLVNALMGLPPVFVGLLIYLFLSRRTPRVSGASVYPDGDDHCPGGIGDADHRRHLPPADPGPL